MPAATKKTVVKATNEPKRYGLSKSNPLLYGKTVQKKTTKASRRSASTLPKSFPEINSRFERIRKGMGLTQHQLALEMGITTSMVKSIENTVVVPNVYCILQLSRVSGRSCDYILKGREHKAKD